MSDTQQPEGTGADAPRFAEPAAGQEASDAPAAEQRSQRDQVRDSAPAPAEGEAQPKAEPEAKERPEREPWFVRRIAELTREKADRDRVLAQAERELQKYRPQPDPNAPPDVERMAQQRAAELVAEREYNRACNASHDAGMAAFPDFGEAMATLAQAGGLSRPVIEAALESGETHKILYQLGRDPDEAARIAGLSPARMGVALAKLAAKPVAPPKVTSAPAPVRSIGGGSVRANDDPEKMSMAEFTAWRERTIAAKRAN